MREVTGLAGTTEAALADSGFWARLRGEAARLATEPQGGRLVASRVMLTYAVSQGTRVAALSSTTSQPTIDSAIRGSAPLLTTMTIDPVVCTPCSSGFVNKTTGDRIAVTARYTFSPAFFSSFARTLTQTSWVVVE